MNASHQPLVPQTSRSKCCLYISCGMAIVGVTVLLAIVVAVFAVTGVDGYPFHASCKVAWDFGVSCEAATQAIQRQIGEWNGLAGCANGGEMCLYTLTSVSNDGSVIRAKHETPVKRYMDDMTFRFTDAHLKEGQTAACRCDGFSTSETWYAVLDYGTNYCNLHNLVIGAGLNATVGYNEYTTDSRCTQYSSADCSKY